MAVSDEKLMPAVPDTTTGYLTEGAGSVKAIPIHLSSVPISQAGVAFSKLALPFMYEVVGVSAWARASAATGTIDVQVNGTTVLTAAITPATGATAPALGTLVTSRIARRGAAGTAVSLVATTNGTGTFTDLEVTIYVRPYPQNGEAYGV